MSEEILNNPPAKTWTADNGNGTFSNPLFYDEFSDPDLIRVGEDYYLTGTTMHAMPGLHVFHSKDLVNWGFLSYAFQRLELGPEYQLESQQQAYGNGIWAPCLRYHAGTFYIFANVNGHTTQLFRAQDPAGPWTQTSLARSLHDLSVLFDDDGKVYVVWGYRDLHLAQLNPDFSDILPGSERVLFPPDSEMGEGSHFYKVGGKYYITSAWWAGSMRMPCARADHPEGPYEINFAISINEDFGLAEGARLVDNKQGPPFNLIPRGPDRAGRVSLHQGGIVSTPAGEWWGFSMMDYNSVGRLTCLSPVTWQEGWPYFGMPGNLTRTPRTWVKPGCGVDAPPSSPFQRSDDFCSAQLNPVWQWNHNPDNRRWSLSERPGCLRLHALPAPDFWWARNTLTQRAVGPKSTATVKLDLGGLQPGDTAGLGLLNFPFAWIGVHTGEDGRQIQQYNQYTGRTARAPLEGRSIWLRTECDFLSETAVFLYSPDGKEFRRLGAEFELIYSLGTFQGVRFALFNFNQAGGPGGYADFSQYRVDEPLPRGLTRPIPVGQVGSFHGAANGLELRIKDRAAEARQFEVVERGLGRVALRANGKFMSVIAPGGVGQVVLREGEAGDAETFQWIETPYGDVALLSLATHRYLRMDPHGGEVTADCPGPRPDRSEGACWRWSKG
jgi:xylan 1,4-beta-xylosidase